MSEVRVRVRITEGKGRWPSNIIKKIEQKFSSKHTQRDLARIKNVVLDHIDLFINSSRVRDKEKHTESWRVAQQNNLVHALKLYSRVEDLGNNKIGLGIGSKRELQDGAPYWFVLNYGFKRSGGVYRPPRTTGYFGEGRKPGDFKGSNVFHHTKGWIGQNPYQRGKQGRLKGKPNKGNSYLMLPMSPVTPMHYLEEMSKVFQIEVDLLEQSYKNVMKEIGSESERGSFLKTLSEKDIIKIQLAGLDEMRASVASMRRVLGR